MRVKGAKKRVAIALAAALVVSGIGYVPKADAESVTQVTGDYSQEVNEVCDTIEFVVSDPAFGSVGGEWAALILGRSGRMTEEWKTKYLAAVKSKFDEIEAATPELKAANKLDSNRLTENSRAIIGLYSAGADVTDFNGWNLGKPLSGDNAGGDKTEESQDYKDTTAQGVNGTVYALLALDYAGYYSVGETKVTDLSQENVTTLRDDYLNAILSKKLETGGWTYFGTEADPDLTMMAVQALCNYMYLPEVKDAVDSALTLMSEKQQDNGGYISWGSENPEAVAQVICGLTMLGIDPTTDERFIKNGNTLVDALKSFCAEYEKDGVTYPEYRGYAHEKNLDGTNTYNQMTTEQAGYAMVALWCQKKGQKLYQNGFRDIPDTTPTATPTATPMTSAVPTETPVSTPTVTSTVTPTATASTPAVTKAPKTTVISKIVKKAAVEKGKKITIKAVVNGKKVKCKVASYNKKALKVTVKNGKLVIKATKKAKTGKTYKVVIKYKKGKKTVRKTVKITVK